MPRLTNAVTGVVVDVADDKVERLGSEWQPVVEKKSTPRAKKSED